MQILCHLWSGFYLNYMGYKLVSEEEDVSPLGGFILTIWDINL